MTSEQSAALVNDPEGGLPRLLEIMRRLRDPQTGCPWDIEQTWDSIAPYTIEEAYEVADAIARRAWDEVQAELGDLLLQVIYFSQIATEEQRFNFDAVANAISDKMVDRHPMCSARKTATNLPSSKPSTGKCKKSGSAPQRAKHGFWMGWPSACRP